MIYNNLEKINKVINYSYGIKLNYIEGCYISLVDWPEGNYNIQFIDKTTKKILYSTTVTGNGWAQCYYKYFIDWRIVISHQGEIVKIVDLNLENARVYIPIVSNSLGDTLAWFPYLKEFANKHKCKVITSTNFNFLFKETYPDIEFVERNTRVENINAHYNISWYYRNNIINEHFHKNDPRTQAMQKTATDILGLEYKEIKPILKLPIVPKEDIIGLGIHSTLQAKYWNNPNGWSEVSEFIKSINYKPLIFSKEKDGHNGNFYPKGVEQLSERSLQEVIYELCKCKAFIGIGSGLSWLAWACNIPLILISGFSEYYTEMEDCIRIEGDTFKCKGCFNRYKLAAHDWNWCPDHKGTDRQFECTKSISSDKVIEKIKQII